MEKWGRGKGEQINEKTVDESSTTGASKKIKKKNRNNRGRPRDSEIMNCSLDM